jgi:hypothetical protein
MRADSGDTVVTGSFRANPKGPDFDVDIRIENTDLTTMNSLLRAHGGFDVVSGGVSFYSEMKIKDGYVKPLFKDLVAYDADQDREKGFVQKLKERVVNVVGKVMKNMPRKEVATKVDISGPVENPQYSTLQIVVRVVQDSPASDAGMPAQVGSRIRFAYPGVTVHRDSSRDRD